MQVLKEESNVNTALGTMLESRNLLRFESMYTSLATLLTRLRPANQQIAFHTPPRQTTVPGDPNYSGGSTETSSSLESKAEPYAQNVALRFMEATYFTVSDWIERVRWANPASKVSLSTQYIHIMLVADCSACQTMEIRLGKAQRVKAIDDGGISMYYRPVPSSKDRSRYVVLSVEVLLSQSY
jgi:hypothetical protein